MVMNLLQNSVKSNQWINGMSCLAKRYLEHNLIQLSGRNGTNYHGVVTS